MAAASFLSGCGTVALRHSFDNYSGVYAETQNRQMLLNLARLHEREPIYFFQLAQISASYTFTETLGLGDLKSIGLPNSTTANIRTANGTLGGTAVHNPIFTLVPLAGDKFAQQLLQPIKPEVFYDLYEEGWPVDLLMRVLIERIEIDTSDIKAPDSSDNETAKKAALIKNLKDKQILILENNPWLYTEDVEGQTAAEAGPIGYYDRFLRACALSREFQRHGLLYVDSAEQFEPSAPVSLSAPGAADIEDAAKSGLVWLPADADWLALHPVGTSVKPWESYDIGPAGKKQDGQSAGEKDGDHAMANGAPRTADSQRAGGAREGIGADADKGAEKKDPKRWVLGKMSRVTYFKLTQNAAAVDLIMNLRRRPEFGTAEQPLDLFKYVLDNGGLNVTDNTTPKGGFKLRLVMRSLMGAMTALAQEKEGFDLFKKRYGEGGKHDWSSIPESERNPALTVIPDGKNLGEPTTALEYRGHTYAIADAADVAGAPQGWNRDVFRLLAQLSFLASTDPTAFAAQPFVQLR